MQIESNRMEKQGRTLPVWVYKMLMQCQYCIHTIKMMKFLVKQNIVLSYKWTHWIHLFVLQEMIFGLLYGLGFAGTSLGRTSTGISWWGGSLQEYTYCSCGCKWFSIFVDTWLNFLLVLWYLHFNFFSLAL